MSHEEAKKPAGEREDYSEVIETLKGCLRSGGKSGAKEEEENFAENDEHRVYARFLTPDGQRIPNMSDHDSIGYRIEALRLYLEKQLSESILMKAYKYLQVSVSDANIGNRIFPRKKRRTRMC